MSGQQQAAQAGISALETAIRKKAEAESRVAEAQKWNAALYLSSHLTGDERKAIHAMRDKLVEFAAQRAADGAVRQFHATYLNLVAQFPDIVAQVADESYHQGRQESAA